MSPDTIVILEDNELRILAMQECLRKILSTPVYVTDNAFRMIDWLREHLHETALISLDHDLPLRSESHPVDHGDGRMVADYLAALPPTCPVIVHSSNDICATGMFCALHHADWPVSRVIPYDGESWIRVAWSEQIQKYRDLGWLHLPSMDD